jgi:hypothetical protein
MPLMVTRLRVTIEGQGGGATNQLAGVIAGILQLAGYATVHITDTATGYSSERGGIEVDAQIVVTPIKCDTPEEALKKAIETGHGSFQST